jgi:imidazole glycerol-phosphate synthase subunit HisF
MPKLRIIPRLEVKGENVVKGIRMEGLRVVGEPAEMSRRYSEEGADELLFMDIVASLYNRNQLHDLVASASQTINLPLAVGGGVRSIGDFQKLLRTGADKIAINTQACATPEIITEAARIFGAQCVIVSIEAKRQPGGGWEPYTQNGRGRTKRDVVVWAREAVERGAGEILLTSVDRDGTRKGLDFELISAVLDAVHVPVVVGGGVSGVDDVEKVARMGASGVTIAHMLHFKRFAIRDLKAELLRRGVPVRALPQSAPV